MNLPAITATIRKDVQLLWPLALSTFVLQLVIQSTLHTAFDYAGIETPIGARPGVLLFWLGIALTPLLSTVFVLMTIHTDIATDARHDWLTRPVGTLDLVAAKTALVLAVVAVPAVIGNTIFVLANGRELAEMLLPVAILLRNCLMGIMLFWMVSSALQAVFTLLGLTVLTTFVTALMLAVLSAFYLAARASAGLPPGELPEFRGTLPVIGRVAIQLIWVAAMMWPVLWLLLVRRRKTWARLLFALVFVVVTSLASLQARPPAPDGSHFSAYTPLRETSYE